LLHQDIEDCAVVPIINEETEQAPVAFVILKRGVSAENAEKAIKKYVEEELECAYRPIRYFFVVKFPLTKVGKVDYHALEQIAAKSVK